MRDRLLAAVLARLQAVQDTDDISHVLVPEAFSEAIMLVRSVPDLAQDIEVAHAAGWLHWWRHQNLPEGDDQIDLGFAIRWLAHVYQQYPKEVPVQVRDYFCEHTVAVTGLRPTDGDDVGAWSRHGVVRHDHFIRTGDVGSLEKATSLFRKVLAAIEPGDHLRANALNNVCGALRDKHALTGDLEVLLESVRLGREAVALCQPSDVNSGFYLSNLGIALENLFERTGELETAEEAVAVAQQAVTAIPAGHPERGGVVSNYAAALRALFRRTGELAVGRDALRRAREAVEVTAADRPERAGYLANVAATSHDLWAATGELAQLREAVAAGRDAVAAAPPDHVERPAYLSNLSGTLATLSRRIGDTTLLAEAVQLSRDAVATVRQGHPGRARFLANLGVALRNLFRETDDQALLAEAIQALRGSVTEAQPDGPESNQFQSFLGLLLQTMFDVTGDLATLREAVETGRAAVASSQPDLPERGTSLTNLGYGLQRLFESTRDEQVLVEARKALTEASRSTASRAVVRVGASRSLGQLEMAAEKFESALSAYESAIELLPQIAPRRLSRSDRLHGLSEANGLAEEAASAAIAAGRPAHAVELLEQARGILLAEALASRSDLDQLVAHAPLLAEEFVRLRDELDRIDHFDDNVADAGSTPFVPANLPTARRLANQRREMGEEWEHLLQRIRGVPALEGFLLPPSIADLQECVTDAPVIVLNVSKFRADALIVDTDPTKPVRNVQLHDVTLDVLIEQVIRLRIANTAPAHGSLTGRLRSPREIQYVLAWLREHVAGRVLEELNITMPAPNSELPRIRWCLVGAMTFLPLHASVLDLVVSTYTSTFRALRHSQQAKKAAASIGPAGRALVVAMPRTPDAPALPGAQVEAERVTALLPGAHTLIGAQATYESVTTVLPHYPVVHFACHGLSDWNAPSTSRLLLHDHSTAPLTVAKVSGLRLSDARLAYLSACSTTDTDPGLADEAVHITSAFQLAGFHHVIGTLWPIDDEVATHITEDFYICLKRSNFERPAHALHEAITRIRARYPDKPGLWAAHIHTGS